MFNINQILDNYSNFLKEYNLKIKDTDKNTYSKNLKLISNINKANSSSKINNNSNSSELKETHYYKNIQSKIKSSIKYTTKKILESDKYDSMILKDSNTFFCVLCSLSYHHIISGKPYLDLTKYL